MNVTFPRPETMDPPDKYDLDEQELLADDPDDYEFRNRVKMHWRGSKPGKIGPSPLFEFLAPRYGRDGDNLNPYGEVIGCPTMIHSNSRCFAWTKELTQFVRNNTLMPDHPDSITPESLTQFKLIQRKADELLGRK
jgi:hypothetical protein